jgi:hypothetical protein
MATENYLVQPVLEGQHFIQVMLAMGLMLLLENLAVPQKNGSWEGHPG